VADEEIILEESFTPASSQVPSPFCLALGQEDPKAGWQSDACATPLQEASWTLVQDKALVLAPSEARSPLQESTHPPRYPEVPEAPTQQGGVQVEMGQGHQEGQEWQDVSQACPLQEGQGWQVVCDQAQLLQVGQVVQVQIPQAQGPQVPVALGQNQGDQEQAHVPLARPLDHVPWQVATHKEVLHASIAAEEEGQVYVEVG